jgi:hypothetical protein
MVLHSSFFIQQLKFKCLLIYYGLQLSYHVRIESPTFHWYDLPSRMWISIFGKLIIYNYDYVNYRGIQLLPRNRSGRLSDAETVSEVLKKYKGKFFRKNIRNLIFGGYMENSDLTPNNFFTNEMNVHLNVFSSLMLNRITREVDCTDVVTVYSANILQHSTINIRHTNGEKKIQNCKKMQ